MPRVEMLREQFAASRLRVKRLARELDDAKATEARKRQQLQAALARKAERRVDAELEVRR